MGFWQILGIGLGVVVLVLIGLALAIIFYAVIAAIVEEARGRRRSRNTIIKSEPRE